MSIAKLNNGLEVLGILGASYGMGWSISNHRGHEEIGHGGSFINGYTASFSRFPEKDFAVIVLTNLNPTNVHWIGYNIAGFFIPELKCIDQLHAGTSADTSFNKIVYAFFKDLVTGNADTTMATENYLKRINPIMKVVFSQSAKMDVHFVGSDGAVNKHLERFGEAIRRINYYRIKFGNETHYLAVYITPGDKIADIRGY